ncbi:hypothetical protein CFC21_100077 [Triticum aestivum]|uniref:Uncharacterized protein n=4 Tax=Triticum TaxID=4564 RepID=A0A9R0ZML0_TRITD|nr:uncharacterized protein LOC119330238 [Triticum dicoccoides]XP_044429331.1 uncharacterized protein LOC123154753 [Triticum aestivum]XP_048541911.1 uncharacterized protein LOC125520913 [Triticum urartu]KAF7098329.1 hypothetical protein CFC21_100077 [Triticum aestivum]VAI80538.1 unnamed protein product [Triticum turgidum subsp. durum]
MKKASRFLKQLFSAIVAAVRERSAATRARTSAARTRFVFFGILRNKQLLRNAINSKIHAIVGGGSGSGQHLVAASGGGRTVAVLEKLPSFVADQGRRAAVLLNSLPSFAMGRDGGSDSPLVGGGEEQKEEGDEGVAKQLQLASAPVGGSVIDLARGAAERGGAEFRLEDEIDHVADVFIRRFHDQMKLQKLESFKRFCEMLERN